MKARWAGLLVRFHKMLGLPLGKMSSSPYQFVPSTPCLHFQNGQTDVASPAATVPSTTDRYQSSFVRNSNTDLLTPIAVVPGTPCTPSTTPRLGKHGSKKRGHRTLKSSRTPSSPQHGDVAEQVVPGTPCGLTSSTAGLQWVETDALQQRSSSGNLTGQPPKRETLLKQRLSPQSKITCIIPMDLFSSDEIFT